MKILGFPEVIELKEAVKERFDEKVHLCDSCGAQVFSLDKDDAALRKFIAEYFTAKGAACGVFRRTDFIFIWRNLSDWEKRSERMLNMS